METAGCLCVPAKLLGDSTNGESICRSLLLQSRPAERSPCQPADNLTLLRPDSPPVSASNAGVAAPAPCVVPFYWTHLSVDSCFKAHTGHRKYRPCHIWVMIWISTWDETISRISVLKESLDGFQNKYVSRTGRRNISNDTCSKLNTDVRGLYHIMRALG